jgi:hypothetical protein
MAAGVAEFSAFGLAPGKAYRPENEGNRLLYAGNINPYHCLTPFLATPVGGAGLPAGVPKVLHQIAGPGFFCRQKVFGGTRESRSGPTGGG